MRPTLLVRLYPRRWRERYGEEFDALLEHETPSPRLIADLLHGAIAAHLHRYPPAEDTSMTRSRVQLTAALVAAVAVLPAAAFFVAAIARQAQPVQHQPARAADALFGAFIGLPAGAQIVLIVVAPTAALVLAAVVLVSRISADADLRADLIALGDVSLRLLRRPAVVLAALALALSAVVLAVLLVHAIVG